MAKLPHPNRLPSPLRVVGRSLLPSGVRARLAADLQHLAHLQYRSHARYRASQSTLDAVRNSRKGEACMILGNGPSMAGEDLAKFAGIATFSLNRGYLMWNSQGLKPSYLVAVNDLIIEQFYSDLAELGAPLFVPWEHHHLFAGCTTATFLEMRWHKRFFTDVRDGLWPGGTVTFAALQIAYHLGFTKVGLIGVDHHFGAQGAANVEVVQGAADHDHFTPDYFGRGVRWNLPDLATSEQAYRMARAAFERDGRSIIDMTRGGRLEVFDKMPFEAAMASGFFAPA